MRKSQRKEQSTPGAPLDAEAADAPKSPPDATPAQERTMTRRSFGTLSVQGVAGISAIGILGGLECKEDRDCGIIDEKEKVATTDHACHVMIGDYYTDDMSCSKPKRHASNKDDYFVRHKDDNCGYIKKKEGEYLRDHDDACTMHSIYGGNHLYELDDACGRSDPINTDLRLADADCGLIADPGIQNRHDDNASLPLKNDADGNAKETSN